MNKETSIEDKIFIKQCVDEYSYYATTRVVPYNVVRRIPSAAMKGTELKELSIIVRSSMKNATNDLNKLFNSYKNRFKPEADVKEIFTDIVKLYEERYNKYDDENFGSMHCSDPFSSSVSCINAALRTINDQIEFVRFTYNVIDSDDEKFNKATPKTIFETDKNDYSSYWTDIEKIEKELESRKIDLYSPEYGKLIINRLKTFKNDLISAFNKYFGKNSIFADFNLTNMIRY